MQQLFPQRRATGFFELSSEPARLPSGPPGSIFQTLVFDVLTKLKLHKQNQQILMCWLSKGIYFGPWGLTKRPRGPQG